MAVLVFPCKFWPVLKVWIDFKMAGEWEHVELVEVWQWFAKVLCPSDMYVCCPIVSPINCCLKSVCVACVWMFYNPVDDVIKFNAGYWWKTVI